MQEYSINKDSKVELINEISNIKLILNNLKYRNDSLRDLTNLKTYTIDEEGSFEIDDAISLEKANNVNKLWIHIASPASFIKYDSLIDSSARKLISTIYLSDNTIYMLPKDLIKNVFSLSQNDERIALSLGVILNEDGSVYSYELAQTLIKTNYRLTYTEADELIDYSPIEEQDLSIISMMLKSRNIWRKNLGAMEILESHGKIIVKNNIPTLKIIDPTLSRQLISEAMILYGDLIANFTIKNDIPVPYRVQQTSDKLGFEKYINLDNQILSNFLLKKSMGKSYYSSKPQNHSSLALSSYIHATSPIRRYADLLVHYQIYSYLNDKNLISLDVIENNIKLINILGRQNINRYREDQKYWINKWFENNSFVDYRVILLNWINRYKNICILHFQDYNFTSICFLQTKLELEIGFKFSVENITSDYNNMLYFKLIS